MTAIVFSSIEPGSRKNVFRRRRFETVLRLIDSAIAETGRCRILDIGGEARYWRGVDDLLQARPVTVDLVNLEAEPVSDSRFTSHAGDGCDLSQFEAGRFDLVHSNSVIEHVGDWPRQMAFASEVRRLAPRYYVQAPCFWFPIEPHYRAPLFHFLPRPIRAQLLYRFKLGFSDGKGDYSQAMLNAEDARLPDAAQFRALFPDARLEKERWLGFTKSLMAVKG